MLTDNGKWALGLCAAMGCAGWAFGYAFLYALCFVLAIALCLSYLWLLRQPELTSFQHLKPPVVGTGQPASAVVIVTNTGNRASRQRLGEYSVDGVLQSITIERLEAGEDTHLTVLLPTTRRGHFPAGPLTITSRDPFGLMQRRVHKGGKASLTVHPQVHPLSALPTGHRREIEGSRSAVPQEGGISFHSLRDYVTGDDRRLIHWRSVAKTNTLMVRKNVVTSEPRYLVVLDTATSSYQGDSFEDAVRMAASMINAGYESRYPVVFRTTGGLETEITTTGEGRTTTMRVLAGIETTDSDPGLNAIVRFRADASGVSLGAVTGRPEPEQLVGLRRVQHLFDMTTLVRLGATPTDLQTERPPQSQPQADSQSQPDSRPQANSVELPGIVLIDGENSQHAADRWKTVFGS